MIYATGVKEIDTIIKLLPKQLDHQIMQRIHAEAAKPFVSAAYYAAPLLTGRTSQSVGVIKPSIRRAASIGAVYAGPRRGRYGGNVAHLSEFGTKRRQTKKGANRGVMPKKPFVEPSWERTKERVRGGITDATGKVVLAFLRRHVKK